MIDSVSFPLNEIAYVFRNLPIGVQLFDVTGKLVNANTAFLNLAGIDAFEQLTYQTIFEDPFLDEESVAAIRQGETVHVTEKTEIDDWIKATLSPVETPTSRLIEKIFIPLAGPIAEYMVTVREIMKELAVPEHTMRADGPYQDLVETSDDLIWRCDQEGKFTYLNPAWQRVLG